MVINNKAKALFINFILKRLSKNANNDELLLSTSKSNAEALAHLSTLNNPFLARIAIISKTPPLRMLSMLKFESIEDVISTNIT